MEPFDIMAPIKRLPFWARMSVCGVLIWSFVDHWTREPLPNEPKMAIWVQLIMLVVTIVLSELLRPKPNLEDARPAGLGDFRFPTATEARVIPLIWGRVKVEGPNVIWYGDLTQTAIREKIKTGLWSSTTITKAWSYKVGVQMGICRGPDVVWKKLWIGDKQVWAGTVDTDGGTVSINEPEFFGGDDLGNGGFSSTIEFYTGSKTQPVSDYLALHQDSGVGTDRTPRYSGTAYMVTRGYLTTDEGAYLGNSTQIKPYAFEVERYAASWAGQVPSNLVGAECNPMNVIYEVLTNQEWGFGFPAADVDAGGAGTSFGDAAAVLLAEGNGFSMALTKIMQSSELLMELERQIDGVVFLDHRTGLWKVKLARADYTIATVPQLTDDNVKEVRDYTRGAYDDTTNMITAKYWKRETDSNGHVHYKESFAVAQDVGNALIQGGGTVATANIVTGEVNFPGCKTSALASSLAWRELRGQAYPLARVTLVVNREFWDLTIGDVVAWTNTQFGYTQLPLRITKIDYGKLQSNQMILQCVQDVFYSATASWGTPEDSLWDPPSVALADYPAAQHVVFEAPRAIVTRDPLYGGDPNVSKIMAAARRQTGEGGFHIQQRNASGTPGGSFADAGEVVAFMRIGALDSALGAGVANPTSTIAIDYTPDLKDTILNSFGSPTLSEMGSELAQIIMVNDEFMFVSNATDGTTVVNFNTVYRGALDSVQGNHAAADDVYLLFVAAGVSESDFTSTYNVDTRLDAFASTSRYSDAATPTHTSWTFAQRPQRPYPPAAVLYNTPAGSEFGTPDMEGDGAGENGFSCDVSFWRRNYTNTDEIIALAADDTGVSGTHETRLRVFVDPDGTNTEIASSPFAWATGTGTDTIPRNELIDTAAASTEIRVQLETRHTGPLGNTNMGSRYAFIHDVVPTSVNDGLFYLGGNIDTGPSDSYVVAAAGIHTIDIAANPSAGNAQYRINGGTWNTYTAGGTATASLSISDTIQVRQSSTGATPDANFTWIDNPSATRVAYGTL